MKTMIIMATVISAAYSITTLAGSKEYRCNFDTYFSPPDGIKPLEDFSMSFYVDTVTGDAFLRGNVGVTQVQVIEHRLGGLNFVEITPAGTIQVTAFDNKGKAAHSRHTRMLDGELLPSQYYGKCVIKP